MLYQKMNLGIGRHLMNNNEMKDKNTKRNIMLGMATMSFLNENSTVVGAGAVLPTLLAQDIDEKDKNIGE